MNTPSTNSAVLSAFNDDLVSVPYGHGELVTLPLHYYDDDRVTVFVEHIEGGIRVSDRGMTLMRLHMAGVNVDSARIDEAWRRSLSSLHGREIGVEEGVISGFGAPERLGRLILDVAEASLRADQLRWNATEPRRAKFSDRVVRRVTEIVGDRATVTPNAAFQLSSGRTRQVTAAVGDRDHPRLYLQAVGGSDRASREKAVEHCHFLFSLGQGKPEQKIAVVADGDDKWNSIVDQELGNVGQVAFYADNAQLRKLVSKAVAAA